MFTPKMFSLIISIIGTETEARIEPKEMYLEINTTTRKIANATSISTVIRVNKNPNAVAIPLPPRNPAKIVHICPSTADNPAII